MKQPRGIGVTSRYLTFDRMLDSLHPKLALATTSQAPFGGHPWLVAKAFSKTTGTSSPERDAMHRMKSPLQDMIERLRGCTNAAVFAGLPKASRESSGERKTTTTTHSCRATPSCRTFTFRDRPCSAAPLADGSPSMACRLSSLAGRPPHRSGFRPRYGLAESFGKPAAASSRVEPVDVQGACMSNPCTFRLTNPAPGVYLRASSPPVHPAPQARQVATAWTCCLSRKRTGFFPDMRDAHEDRSARRNGGPPCGAQRACRIKAVLRRSPSSPDRDREGCLHP